MQPPSHRKCAEHQNFILGASDYLWEIEKGTFYSPWICVRLSLGVGGPTSIMMGGGGSLKETHPPPSRTYMPWWQLAVSCSPRVVLPLCGHSSRGTWNRLDGRGPNRTLLTTPMTAPGGRISTSLVRGHVLGLFCLCLFLLSILSLVRILPSKRSSSVTSSWAKWEQRDGHGGRINLLHRSPRAEELPTIQVACGYARTLQRGWTTTMLVLSAWVLSRKQVRMEA